MNHLGTVTLETERLILREFVPEDAVPMYKNWASDPEVTAFLTWPPHASLHITEEVIRQWIRGYQKPDFYEWAIELKELGQAIGSISVVEHDNDVGRCHIGYCLGKEWWHKGIMTEALGAVMTFLFDHVQASRIDSRHDTRNPRSGAVMVKCGMVFEGIHRQSDRNNQGICDAAWYAALRSDR